MAKKIFRYPIPAQTIKILMIQETVKKQKDKPDILGFEVHFSHGKYVHSCFLEKAPKEEASGNSASYMITGLGYSTDVIVTFTGGVVGTVVICSPFFFVDGIARSRGTLTEKCVDNVTPKILKEINPQLGDKAFVTTASWRCPNVDSIGRALIEVAKCYKEKGEIVNSKLQIEEIQSSDIFKLCLSPKMKEEISSFEISLKN